MTTKTTTTKAAKTTTKAAPKAAPVMDIAVLVEAFKAAETTITGYTTDMDFIAAQRTAARVQASRAAVAIFQHPEGKSQYATAAKLAGVARNTFRPYVDAGLALSAARRTATDVTPADMKKVEPFWANAAAAKKATRAAAPKAGISNTPDIEGESAESVGLPTGDAAPKAVTFADVQASVKALREVVAAYRGTDGGFSEKELRGLGVQLANVAKLASKGE